MRRSSGPAPGGEPGSGGGPPDAPAKRRLSTPANRRRLDVGVLIGAIVLRVQRPPPVLPVTVTAEPNPAHPTLSGHPTAAPHRRAPVAIAVGWRRKRSNLRLRWRRSERRGLTRR